MRGSPTKKGLVLADNVVIGYQLATLLKNNGWQLQVVHRDAAAYSILLNEKVQVVVADIETPDLGGLAVLTYCHHHYPSIETYALVQSEDSHLKKMARDVAGCQGFFYLERGSLQIDTSRGMAVTLLNNTNQS